MKKLIQSEKTISDQQVAGFSHLLFVLPFKAGQGLPADIPCAGRLRAVLARRGAKFADLCGEPVSADLEHGGVAAWVALDGGKSRFEQQTALRKALQLLLREHPRELAVAVFGGEEERRNGAQTALYGAWVNGAPLPVRKRKGEKKLLSRIALYGYRDREGFASLRAQAEGNLLARELTMLPANELTPGLYRERIRKLAREHGWELEEYDLRRLRKIGAGAFVAVAQGSAEEDAAIVRLRYAPDKARGRVALVGKGICFDTGGHNLKPARYMHGMHEDMNGSAVALGLLLAATRSGLDRAVDCWLALAQNHISPSAYKQNDVVTALNGTTIEVVHTDAEGRMVLADTLTLAAKEKPGLIVDFATLTGGCVTALGTRYSGVFGNREALLAAALEAGRESGERVCAFPLDADYEEALESKIADVKQCTLEGEADHILAARFLQRFVDDTPWLHVDLSASNCKGGLGAVAEDVTGFGVGLGLALLRGEAAAKAG